MFSVLMFGKMAFHLDLLLCSVGVRFWQVPHSVCLFQSSVAPQ